MSDLSYSTSHPLILPFFVNDFYKILISLVSCHNPLLCLVNEPSVSKDRFDQLRRSFHRASTKIGAECDLRSFLSHGVEIADRTRDRRPKPALAVGESDLKIEVTNPGTVSSKHVCASCTLHE